MLRPGVRPGVGNNDHFAETCRDSECRRLPCVLFKEGYRKGYDDGWAAGRAAGYSEGYQAGYSSGFDAGTSTCP